MMMIMMLMVLVKVIELRVLAEAFQKLELKSRSWKTNHPSHPQPQYLNTAMLTTKGNHSLIQFLTHLDWNSLNWLESPEN